MDEHKKTKIMMAIAIVLAVLVGVALFGLYKSRKAATAKVDYEIAGVPYFGRLNHTGQNKVISGDTVSAAISILEYWNPGQNNFVETNRSMSAGQKFITGESVRNFFTQAGYVAKEVHLENNELKQYINSDSKTPLFAFLSVDGSQPKNDAYHPAEVIIGVKESEEKVVMHDYWLGNNYEISFAELDQRWGQMRKDEQKKYIIIQPQNLSEKLAELKTRKIEDYSRRTVTMEKSAEMLKNYTLGVGEEMSNLNLQAKDYFLKVEEDPNFNTYLPPYFKVMTYYHLAKSSLAINDLDLASVYAQKAVDIDHDLNKPSNDWPGFEDDLTMNVSGELSYPWAVLGDVSLATKNYPKAKEAYEKALQLEPKQLGLKDSLRMVELALLKSK